MTFKRKIYFEADEGFQAVILELIGKNHITHSDFNCLVKALLLDAHGDSNGNPILVSRRFSFVCTDPFYKSY